MLIDTSSRCKRVLGSYPCVHHTARGLVSPSSLGPADGTGGLAIGRLHGASVARTSRCLDFTLFRLRQDTQSLKSGPKGSIALKSTQPHEVSCNVTGAGPASSAGRAATRSGGTQLSSSNMRIHRGSWYLPQRYDLTCFFACCWPGNR